MITTSNYKTIQELKSTNPEVYKAISQTSADHLKSLGIASHEIKNMVSFMNSSYQLISKQHPETADFKFWKEFGTNIKQLIEFMDRTSIYRYCMTSDIKPVSLTDLLYRLPDEADTRNPEEDREFMFDIKQDITVLADSEHLLMALSEIIANCYEATTFDDTITIAADVDTNLNVANIVISNPGTFPKIEYSEPGSFKHVEYDCTDASILCKPFYSTKHKHSGLGLSIAHTVCTNHNGELFFTQSNNESRVHIRLPIA